MMTGSRRYQKHLSPQPHTLDISYLLPAVVTDPATGREVTIAYDVQTLIQARTNDRELGGILTDDLTDTDEWGTIPIQPHKARRWVNKGRLIKRITTSPDGSLKNRKTRYTYAEAKEWQAVIGELDQAWLAALVEVDLELSEEKAKAKAAAEAPRPKPKVKAKHRRQRDRNRTGKMKAR